MSLTEDERFDGLEFPPRYVTRLDPTSRPHVGQALGAGMPHMLAAGEYPGETFLIIADSSALAPGAAGQLRQLTFETALDQLALGANPYTVSLTRQSDVPQVFELMWILACYTKDTAAAGVHVDLLSHSLVAADILGIRATVVGVEGAKRPEVEGVRQLASRVNATHGALFPLPHARPHPDRPDFAGLGLFDAPEQWEKTLFGLGTGQRKGDLLHRSAAELGLAPLNEAVCPALVPHVVHQLDERLAPLREKRRQLAERPDDVEDILQSGSKRVRRELGHTLEILRDALGFGRYRRRTWPPKAVPQAPYSLAAPFIPPKS